MKYYIDTEFSDAGIISLALVPATHFRTELYIAFDQDELRRECAIFDFNWVSDNVLPIIDVGPVKAERIGERRSDIAALWPQRLEQYFANDHNPHIVADWPIDIVHLCNLLITGPGTAIRVPRMSFEWTRKDPYPTKLAGAVQHNSLWDARALRFMESYE